MKKFTIYNLQFTNRTTRGFTLIEMLIYSALVAIFTGSIFVFTNNILGSNDRIIARNEVFTNQEFINSKIAWLSGQATSVLAPSDSSATSTLTLYSTTNLFPAELTLQNQKINLILGSGTSTPITSSSVRVKQFSVQYFSTAGQLPNLRVLLEIESAPYSSIKSSSTFSYVLP